MMGFATKFRRAIASTSLLWCFLALILTSKFEFGSCQQEEKEVIVGDPRFSWDGFRLNIDYTLSESVVAERVTHDIVSDEDCIGGIIDKKEIESEVIDVSDNQVRISLLMNPESIHSSRYVKHLDDYAVVGICARLWINRPINNEYQPVTGYRDDYMLIRADLEDLKGILEILDDKAKNWGIDVYRCDYSNNRETNPRAIRNGEKLRLCVEPTQRTKDENVYMGTIKSLHFQRDGFLQKAVATYGTDDVTRVFDCHRGSQKCAIETILSNDFFFAPGEVKAEGLVYLQWGYEKDRMRNRYLRSIPVKVNVDLGLQQHPEDRALYEWYEQGEIVSEKSNITMIEVEPMNKVYKAEAYACDENNKPNRKTTLNETETMRICVKPNKEAREAGVYINSFEDFEFGLANDDKVQTGVDTFGVAADDNKTTVECTPGADVCALEADLRSWFFDEDAPMVASGYVVLQFGNFGTQQGRKAQMSSNGYGADFAGRDQVEAFFQTVGRGPEVERRRPSWFEDIFEKHDLSETHLTILYVVAVILFVLILLCCFAGCLFFFWYGRGTREAPRERSQHIDIKINEHGKEISQSEFQDERRESQTDEDDDHSPTRRGSTREGSRSNTDDDFNNSYSIPHSPAPSRRGSNRIGTRSYGADDDSRDLSNSYSNNNSGNLYAAPRRASKLSSRGGGGGDMDDELNNSYGSNMYAAARRGSNDRGSMPRRASNDRGGGSVSRRGSNDRGSMSRRGSNDRGSMSRRGSNEGGSRSRRGSNEGGSVSRRGSNDRGSMSRRGSNEGGSVSRRGSNEGGSVSRRGSNDRGSMSRRGSNEGGSRSRRGSNNGSVPMSPKSPKRRRPKGVGEGSHSHTEDDDIYSTQGSRRGSRSGRRGSNEGSTRGGRRGSNEGGSVSRRGSAGGGRRGSNGH